MKKAFTLLEILIVVSLLVMLAVGLILVFNPKTQIDKANDGKRKAELTSLNKSLEDWYNDHNCYPKPDEICYNAVSGETTCNICGNEAASPDFSPYLSTLPCDPTQPTKKYVYIVDDEICPSTYWIYLKLANESDPLITQLGCQNGCGPYGDCNYNYGVASPNESVEYCTDFTLTPTAIPTPTPVYVGNCSSYNPIYFIPDVDGVCNYCGTYPECNGAYPDHTFYADTQCTQVCFKN
jgi:prepilin-type N-terminal cleavage/methylation domain-containing protein